MKIAIFGSPNSGKTTSLLNIGPLLAKENVKVLYMENDWKQPYSAAIFGPDRKNRGYWNGIAQEKNLLNYLTAEKKFREESLKIKEEIKEKFRDKEQNRFNLDKEVIKTLKEKKIRSPLLNNYVLDSKNPNFYGLCGIEHQSEKFDLDNKSIDSLINAMAKEDRDRNKNGSYDIELLDTKAEDSYIVRKALRAADMKIFMMEKGMKSRKVIIDFLKSFSNETLDEIFANQTIRKISDSIKNQEISMDSYKKIIPEAVKIKRIIERYESKSGEEVDLEESEKEVLETFGDDIKRINNIIYDAPLKLNSNKIYTVICKVQPDELVEAREGYESFKEEAKKQGIELENGFVLYYDKKIGNLHMPIVEKYKPDSFWRKIDRHLLPGQYAELADKIKEERNKINGVKK